MRLSLEARNSRLVLCHLLKRKVVPGRRLGHISPESFQTEKTRHTGDLHVALRAIISLQPLRCFKACKFNGGVDLNMCPHRGHSILHALADYSCTAVVEVLQIGAEARFRELGDLHRLREISGLANQFLQTAGGCKEVPPFNQVTASVKDEALVKVDV